MNFSKGWRITQVASTGSKNKSLHHSEVLVFSPNRNESGLVQPSLKNTEFVSGDPEDMEQAMLDEEDEPLFEAELQETAEVAIGLAQR